MSSDLLQTVISKLQAANDPVSFSALKKAIITKRSGVTSEMLDEVLKTGVEQKAIHRWHDSGASKNRYWATSAESKLREGILQACSQQALKKGDIKVKGFPKAKVLAELDELAESKELQKYPGLGQEKTLWARTGATEAYVEAIRVFLRPKLKRAGIEESAVFTGASTVDSVERQSVTEEHVADLAKAMLEKAVELEPQKDSPVSLSRLRRALGLDVKEKEVFDRAALLLKAQHRIYLSPHDNAFGISQGDRDLLVDGKDGHHYVALTLRAE